MSRMHLKFAGAGSGHAGEVFIQQPIRPHTMLGRAANLRPQIQHRVPYPTIHCLALAVLAQAAKDAQPEQQRGGRDRVFSEAVRERQFKALTWLCSGDPDLLYWCELADYPCHCLRHKYRPLLDKAIRDWPWLADRFIA